MWFLKISSYGRKSNVASPVVNTEYISYQGLSSVSPCFMLVFCVQFRHSTSIHPRGVHIIQPTPCERRADSRQPGWLCDATPLKSCNKPATSAVRLLLRSEAGTLWSPAAELTSNVTLSLSFCPLCFSFPFFFSLYTSRDRQSDADTHTVRNVQDLHASLSIFGINSRMQRNNSVTFVFFL